jgi:small subunit ribosomal protein S5
MTQPEATTDVTSEAAVPVVVPATDAPAAPHTSPIGARRGGASDAGNRRNERRPRRGARPERQKPEFDQKIISIRRVTRVMGGGRRFSFSVAMVIGDKRGKVGVGIGKAGDTQLAIEKAIRDAKKNMITIVMNKDSHLPHDVHVKYASSEVMIIPAPGRGLVAGSSVRTVLELGGVKDVTAKIFSRSKNKLNNARAAVEALKQLKKAS